MGEYDKKAKQPRLGLNLSFVDQHDRQTVTNRINAVALRTLQALRLKPVIKLRLASRTNQHLNQFLRQHAPKL